MSPLARCVTTAGPGSPPRSPHLGFSAQQTMSALPRTTTCLCRAKHCSATARDTSHQEAEEQKRSSSHRQVINRPWTLKTAPRCLQRMPRASQRRAESRRLESPWARSNPPRQRRGATSRQGRVLQTSSTHFPSLAARERVRPAAANRRARA